MLRRLQEQPGQWGWCRKLDPLFQLLGDRYMLKLDKCNGELDRPDPPYSQGRPERSLCLEGQPDV